MVMYLKKIEIYGFKSFAEKTVLDFSSGITAIIGPNGCGKSNVIDAIRWVLGEQSPRTLRGVRMEEVIFSGTEKRKPLNFAEVSLLFDDADDFLNIDFSQVEITRRLYRSGESEYFINKSPCRLKDINELFMDTGIGKEVYSIVGQNRVEEIINSRPEDRRELFEEASGILKYKQRKKEAHRKLEEMESNMIRVNDLIGELENQLEPLQEQAEVARCYQGLISQQREKEKQILKCKLIKKKNNWQRSESQLHKLQEDMVEISGKISHIEVSLEENLKQEREIKTQKEDLEKELDSFKQEKEKIESDQKFLNEKQKYIQNNINELFERSKYLEHKKQELEDNLQEWESKINKFQDQQEQVKKEIENLHHNLNEYQKDDIINTMDELQRESLTVNTKIEGLTSKHTELNKHLSRLNDNKKQLQIKIDKDNDALSELDSKIRKKENVKEDKSQRLKNYMEQFNEEQKKMEKLEGQENRLQAQIKELNNELNEYENRLWIIEKWEQEIKKTDAGVQNIWEAIERNDPKVYGIEESLFSIISVPSHYRKAIEAALEEKSSALLAVNEEAIINTISYLKKEQKGRASFLPLNWEHNNNLYEEASEIEEIDNYKQVLTTANRIVKVPARFQKFIYQLLLRVIIVETLRDAIDLASRLSHYYTIVTLDGEAILPGGFLRGGEAPSEEKITIWSGEESIKELQQKVSEFDQKCEKKEAELQEILEEKNKQKNILNKYRNNIDNQKQEIEQLKQEINSITIDRNYRKENLNQNNHQLTLIKEEEKEIYEQEFELKEQLKELRKQKEKLDLKQKEFKTQYQSTTNEIENLKQQITDNRIEYNKIKEQQSNLQEKIKKTQEEISEIKEELQQHQHKIEAFKNELTQLNHTKGENEEKLKQLAQDSVDTNRKYEEVFSSFQSLQSSIKELENESRNLREKLRKLEKREREKELEKTRLKAEFEGLLNNYKEKYGENFEDAYENNESQNMDENEMEEELEKLKEEIEKLGPVNTGSIDELKRIEERVNFLKNQKEDLEKGERSLQQVLEQINLEIKQYFSEAIKAVGENFQNTFAELFGGGYALLRLTQPDNLLESGIEIVARPPGKSLQNISLLSSGEKALTVIALIFAILAYKPAPFYFLDEIESSLDDHNLTKFTAYLNKLTRRAQFILVTHRKTTTEIAELIYGVTMPESGVTKILSLKPDEQILSQGV